MAIHRYMRRLGLAGVCFSFLCSALSGCADLKEINDLAVVTALGFDITPDGKFEVITQIFLPVPANSTMPTTGGAQSSTFAIMSARGSSITEATNNIEKRLSRQLFRSHDRAIFISKRMARTHLRDVLDYCLRFREIRERVNMFICGTSISELLTYPPFLEKNSGELMNKIIQKDGNLSVTILNALMMRSYPTRPNILPIISVQASPVKKAKKTISIEQSAVFRNDRLVGSISHYLTFGQLMMTGRFWQTTFTLKIPHNHGVIGLNLQNVKAKITPEIVQGQWLVHVRLTGDEIIFENTTALDTQNEHDVQRINKTVEKKMSTLIHQSVQASQHLGSDVFGLYRQFYRTYPHEAWTARRHWQTLYPRIRIRVAADVNLLQSGIKQ
ncbi:MAG: Ger(x)C family spore germination protein [Sporolactobacillus sp.]